MKRQCKQERSKALAPEHDPNNMTLDVPRDWTPMQAAAVFETLDLLQVRIWGRYGPSIQQVLWEKQMAPKSFSTDEIEERDVPF